jgi:acyl-coenzyme A synthetase/AMP-(fatty) acid ligase
MTAPPFALLQRGPEAALFQTPEGQVVRAGAFLAAAARLAQRLPAGVAVLNLCEQRLGFALGFAAALLRGQLSLLSADRSPARLAALVAQAQGGQTESGQTQGVVVLSENAPPGLSHASIQVEPRVCESEPCVGEGACAVENPVIPPERVVARVFTSGSTGAPVPHEKTWGALTTRSAAACARFGLAAAGPVSIVGTVPAQHMYGFETTLLLAFHAPVSVWCGPAFYPRDIAAALAAMPAPRTLVTTPLQLRALLDAAIALPPLAGIISATAALPLALAERAEARWQTRVFEIFGATEAGSIASRAPSESDIWQAYPGLSFAAEHAGAEDGSVLRVSGPFMAPVALADAVEWLSPESFRLLGRRSDVVKLGGKRASLAGLTRILTAIEGVEDGIFIAPDDLDAASNARLIAFVVAPRRSADDILAALRREIDPLFLPRRVIRLARLPRNEIGKLPQESLMRLAAGNGEI